MATKIVDKEGASLGELVGVYFFGILMMLMFGIPVFFYVTSAETQGTLTKVSAEVIEVEYVDKNGVQFVAEIERKSSLIRELSPGDRVHVRYAPGNPTNVFVRAAQGNHLVILYVILVALGMAAIVLQHQRYNRARAELKMRR